MKRSAYKRKPGEFELRVLPDGRVVMIAPDEDLLKVARVLEPDNRQLPPETEDKKNA